MRTIRIRTLLIVVAAVALVLGGGRAFELTTKGSFYRETAGTYRSRASGYRKKAADPRIPAGLAAYLQGEADSADHKARRFELAAERPWLPCPIHFLPDE